MEIEKIARDILGRYQNDEIMLDAFFQWACNPTSMSAGYGLEKNYPYIAKNLAARYSIPRREAEKRVEDLQNVCYSMEEQVEKLSYIEPRKRINEIKRYLREILIGEEPGCLLRHGVLRRLREVSEETRKAILLFNLLEEVHAIISPHNFIDPPDSYKNYQAEAHLW